MRHPPPSTALRGPIKGSTESPSGTARMRHPPPNTAFRGSTTRCSVSWPHGELHRTARVRHPPPSTTLRDPMGGSTESPSGTARMRHPPP
eukprot:5047301-Pyramimonas_sp.AAC.1